MNEDGETSKSLLKPPLASYLYSSISLSKASHVVQSQTGMMWKYSPVVNKIKTPQVSKTWLVVGINRAIYMPLPTTFK